MNTFGLKFRLTTFGESHGAGIGCVIDGVPAGLEVDKKYIQAELNKRKPGQNRFSTPRKEDDEVEILSGVFEGLSTGTPIALFIKNSNQKSKDYNDIKDLFRPGHADMTYFYKYGLRDYRGGGRSSARESAARVAGGAIALKMLESLGVKVQSGVYKIGDIESEKFDFEYAKTSEIYALDSELENAQKELISKCKKSCDSIGGAVLVNVKNIPIGLGEPLYHKLDAQLSGSLMGINGVKAVEIGEGVNASNLKGSQNNDQISKNGFLSNHSGGVLGGISNGEDINIKVHFKPTPSIFLPQSTIDADKNIVKCQLKGRHDPCIAIRGSVVAKSMVSLVIADMLLLNMSSTMSGVRGFYDV